MRTILVVAPLEYYAISKRMASVTSEPLEIAMVDTAEKAKLVFNTVRPALVTINLDDERIPWEDVVRALPTCAVIIAGSMQDGPHIRRAYELGVNSVRRMGGDVAPESRMLALYRYWLSEETGCFLPDCFSDEDVRLQEQPDFPSSNSDSWN